eukprot:jgi/Tetstr1/463807/TSEL_008622.t1
MARDEPIGGAAVAPAAGAPAAGEGGNNQGGGWDATIRGAVSLAFRMYLAYTVLSFTMSWMTPGPQHGGPDAGSGRVTAASPAAAASRQRGAPDLVRRNLFRQGERLDMWLYVSERPNFSEEDPSGRLVWQQRGIRLCADEPRRHAVRLPLSQELQNNGSAFLHAMFARSGFPALPSAPDFKPEHVFSNSYPLVRHLAPPKRKATLNLLQQGGTAREPEESSALQVADGPEEGAPVAYWKPNVTISLVEDFTAYPDSQIPPPVREHMVIDPYTGHYYPTIWFNDFWLLREHLLPLNSSVAEVDLFLELDYAHVFKWQMLKSMDVAFAQQQDFGAMGENEAEMIKRIFIESNPYFLALTMAVSLLHTVFDLLAFKSDIGFWRNNKSMEGLSARSILIQSGCQLIVFLYLLDNETSYTILFSSGLGLVLEFWKITKAMKVSVVWRGPLPLPKFEDRLSYTSSKTKQYDAEAIRYLSYALYPLVGGYAIYALMYRSHRSWYSWVVNSLVGAVYAFGFILMCPQLYLNYKLKSVAHMPWRQMTYKFLNTIVDDLFAFVIKMPTLHRLSVFRDDLIFCIFLYQRWIYRVDKSRVNEFGFSAEPPPEGDAAALPAPLAAESESVGEGEDVAAAKNSGDDSHANGGSKALRRRGAASGAGTGAAGAGGKSDESSRESPAADQQKAKAN